MSQLSLGLWRPRRGLGRPKRNHRDDPGDAQPSSNVDTSVMEGVLPEEGAPEETWPGS